MVRFIYTLPAPLQYQYISSTLGFDIEVDCDMAQIQQTSSGQKQCRNISKYHKFALISFFPSALLNGA